MQILSTEHWGLLATRSLAWNESFSRAGMFLSTLSGAIVALALVAQATSFGTGFVLFALVILPVVLFVGVATFLRLGASNSYDALCVIGMNRIRGAYLELAPDLERYFVMSANDDARGIGVTMGATGSRTVPLAHMIAATPMLVIVLDSVIAAAIAAIVMLQIQSGSAIALGVAAVVFLASFALHSFYARSLVISGQAALQPLFPTRDTD
jgi:hypothetical protein